MVFDGRYSGEYSGGDETTQECPKKAVDYTDPASVIETILDEIDCRNHFTRSRVFIVADRVLRGKIKTVREIALHIRFHGPDDFCTRFGDQEEIPTTPSTPNARDLRRTLTDTDFPPSTRSVTGQSSSGLLRANIHEMKQKIEAAFSEGAAPSQIQMTNESQAPSSHRFPARKP